MLEQMIQSVIEKFIRTRYHHIMLPSAMYARVTKVQEHAGYYSYSLKILDENKEVVEEYPEIPDVRSEVLLEPGDVTAVILLYGQLNVYIVGKVI